MKYILVLFTLLTVFSCIPVETPYFVLNVEDHYGVADGDILYHLKIPYEFSSEKVLMPMRVVFFRDTTGSEDWEFVWGFEEIASESGYIDVNDDSGSGWEADLRGMNTVYDNYAIRAELLSDRYGGEPEVITCLTIFKTFRIGP